MARFCARCGASATTSVTPAAPPPHARRLPDGPTLWDEFKPLIWLFLGLLLCSLFFGWSAGSSGDVSLEPWFHAASGALILGFVYPYREQVLPGLRLGIPTARAVADFALVVVLLFPALELVFFALQASGVPFGNYTRGYRMLGWPVWYAYVLTAIVPPILEEIAFRGIYQGMLERFVGKHHAWLLQAALFSVLHLTPLVFITHFGIGLAFGWLRNRTGSLYPGMVAHGLWNAWVIWKELHQG